MKSLTAAIALSLVACGIPKEQFDAKVIEAENYKKQYQDESAKTKDLQAKVAELQAKVDELSKAKADLEASLNDSDAKRRDLDKKVQELTALNDELSKSKKKLAEAKEALEKKSSEYEELAKSLKGEIDAGKIELSELKGRMTVKMKDKILFSSGSVKVNKEGQEALAKVADALKSVKGKIIHVEGYTDNVPTDPKGPYPTNWELSTARATVVTKFLQEHGVPPQILSAVGYGEYQPVASNSTTEGKSLNRRIDIVLAPGEQAPTAAAKTAMKTN
jgi:chemotaxis protein MotB